MRLLVCLAAAVCLFTLPSPGQRRVDPRNRYERIFCVLPMVGAGTQEDPRRPLHAPVPSPAQPAGRDGILSFSYQVSDDGRFALVEFVAAGRSAFEAILGDRRPDVRVFEKGRALPEDVEREFRRLKKDFDARRFGAVAQ